MGGGGGSTLRLKFSCSGWEVHRVANIPSQGNMLINNLNRRISKSSFVVTKGLLALSSVSNSPNMAGKQRCKMLKELLEVCSWAYPSCHEKFKNWWKCVWAHGHTTLAPHIPHPTLCEKQHVREFFSCQHGHKKLAVVNKPWVLQGLMSFVVLRQEDQCSITHECILRPFARAQGEERHGHHVGENPCTKTKRIRKCCFKMPFVVPSVIIAWRLVLPFLGFSITCSSLGVKTFEVSQINHTRQHNVTGCYLSPSSLLPTSINGFARHNYRNRIRKRSCRLYCSFAPSLAVLAHAGGRLFAHVSMLFFLVFSACPIRGTIPRTHASQPNTRKRRNFVSFSVLAILRGCWKVRSFIKCPIADRLNSDAGGGGQSRLAYDPRGQRGGRWSSMACMVVA